MSFLDSSALSSARLKLNRRDSTDTTHWNPRDSLPGKIDTSILWNPRDSLPGKKEAIISPVNVLELAKGWQQKQQHNNEEEEENDDHPQDNEPLIWEPPNLDALDLSPEQIDELFIEMCFYARLGFVQPPCCLKCTYRESLLEYHQEEHSPSCTDTCTRWVIWRRNAETPLHPNKLEGNIVLVQCHASRRLLEGTTVDGYAWDKANKKLVLCCPTDTAEF